VILLVTGKAATPGFAGLAIGLSLTAVHLVGIPLTGTSVNPARSLGPALFAGGDPLAHVWLFIVAPLVGAAVAVVVVKAISVPLAPAAQAAAVDETGVQLPPDLEGRVPESRQPAATETRDQRRSPA
jgi:aquaporin Z